MLQPILISLLAGSATIVGFLLSLRAKHIVKRFSYAVVSLAAGVLLGTAFFHILPETYELLGPDTFLWVLIGFVVFFLIEAVIGFHACAEGEHDHDKNHHHTLSRVAGAGIFLHSLLDGVAIAVGFEISTTLGIVTAVAVTLHELPEGIFTFSIFLHNKMKLKTASWWTIAVALATPLGTAATLLFFPNLSEHVLGILLAIAAGSFLYISASDLIPESHKPRSFKISLFLLVGLLLSFALNSVLPHDHDEEHHEEDEVHELTE